MTIKDEIKQRKDWMKRLGFGMKNFLSEGYLVFGGMSYIKLEEM